jgi:hypothetical protein
MSNINLFPELDNDQEQEQEYNNGHNEYKEEELIVFGYSCKLFRDDFFAKAIDRGQSLIPWNGDENVMIDRCAKNNVFFSVLFLFLFDKSYNKLQKRYLLIFFIFYFFYKIETRKYW